MQNKQKKIPNIIMLMILTLTTILFWILFSIYNVFTNKPSPAVTDEIIQQIDPKLDIQTLNMMKDKTP